MGFRGVSSIKGCGLTSNAHNYALDHGTHVKIIINLFCGHFGGIPPEGVAQDYVSN